MIPPAAFTHESLAVTVAEEQSLASAGIAGHELICSALLPLSLRRYRMMRQPLSVAERRRWASAYPEFQYESFGRGRCPGYRAEVVGCQCRTAIATRLPPP